MDCFICHKSNWMQEKCLGFLRNLLENYKEKIEDSDVFLPLECKGADDLLVGLVRESFSPEQIEKMSKCGSRRMPRLDLDDDSVHNILFVLWNRDDTHAIIPKIIPKLFENALSTPWDDNGGKDLFMTRCWNYSEL